MNQEKNDFANISPLGCFPYSNYSLLLNIVLFKNSQQFFLQGTHLTMRNPIWMVPGGMTFICSFKGTNCKPALFVTLQSNRSQRERTGIKWGGRQWAGELGFSNLWSVLIRMLDKQWLPRGWVWRSLVMPQGTKLNQKFSSFSCEGKKSLSYITRSNPSKKCQ